VERLQEAPVENREGQVNKKANKRQTLFSLKIRLCDIRRFCGMVAISEDPSRARSSRFFISAAPGVATLESRTEGVPSVAAVLEFVWFDSDLENVGLHVCRASRLPAQGTLFRNNII